jgi:hypothetical protein
MRFSERFIPESLIAECTFEHLFPNISPLEEMFLTGIYLTIIEYL